MSPFPDQAQFCRSTIEDRGSRIKERGGGVSVIGQPQAWQTGDPAEKQVFHGQGAGGVGDGLEHGPRNVAGKAVADPASGHARLRHGDGPWTRAAGDAEALHTHLGTARSELVKSHEGLLTGEGAGNFAVLAELAAVRESWVRRVSTAQGECGSLAGTLRAVSREQRTTDEAVRDGFGRPVDVPAQSTPPLRSPTQPLSSLYLLGGSDG